jgi:hypothetical protein
VAIERDGARFEDVLVEVTAREEVTRVHGLVKHNALQLARRHAWPGREHDLD